MPKSPHFARIREHVLLLTAAVPKGKICTYRSMGEYLDVMPRHVAYILSTLKDSEKLVYPWHRVVGGDGSLGTRKQNPDGTSQAELLRSEGVLISENRVAIDLDRWFVAAESLPSGLGRQRRPADSRSPMKRRGA
jgi:alkylated DNA nucleotide flippase Atl1